MSKFHKKACINFFTSKKGIYNETRAQSESLGRYSEELVRNDFTILDIGCGDGGLLNRLLVKTSKCLAVGVDLCRPLVREGKNRYANSAHLQFIIADATNLPFRNHVFDLALMVTLLHHIVATTSKETRGTQKKILNNAKDAIRPEGKLLLRELCPHNRLISVLLFWLSQFLAPLHLPFAEVSFLTEPQLRKMVDSTFYSTQVQDRFPWRHFGLNVGNQIIIRVQ